MNNPTVKFWLILLVVVLLAAMSIGLVFKIAKALVWLLLVLLLSPVIYVLLRLLLPKRLTGKPDKLKHRD